MLTITKEFHFSASHVLEGLPSWHPCSRMHGHNYVVVLELSAAPERLVPPGFVRDYRDLDKFKQWVDKTLDHRHLNESAGGGGYRQRRIWRCGFSTSGSASSPNSRQ
nr:6-pyruvoyl tetrahydropterin synthase family protein [Glycomyces tenuis]